eukprot:7389429-Lingulodinium_polyedra.AAC.1
MVSQHRRQVLARAAQTILGAVVLQRRPLGGYPGPRARGPAGRRRQCRGDPCGKRRWGRGRK